MLIRKLSHIPYFSTVYFIDNTRYHIFLHDTVYSSLITNFLIPFSLSSVCGCAKIILAKNDFGNASTVFLSLEYNTPVWRHTIQFIPAWLKQRFRSMRRTSTWRTFTLIFQSFMQNIIVNAQSYTKDGFKIIESGCTNSPDMHIAAIFTMYSCVTLREDYEREHARSEQNVRMRAWKPLIKKCLNNCNIFFFKKCLNNCNILTQHFR